ncbi:hypothetical protein PUN28_004057 [Cardiocondyla obscurior]|uniref:Uncharacterized protein n=1 Tax=Cardiocondyla obscurior TaxID=286306 RepID=A0AAW2GPD3_9HYME
MKQTDRKLSRRLFVYNRGLAVGKKRRSRCRYGKENTKSRRGEKLICGEEKKSHRYGNQ